MNANVAIQVLPSVLEDEEIVRIVDEVIDYIKSTGVTYYVRSDRLHQKHRRDLLRRTLRNCDGRRL